MSDDEQPRPACPKCGEPMSVEMVSQLKESSTMRMAIHPNPGELLALTTVGGVMLQMEKMMSALARHHGTTSTCLLTDVVTREDGAIEFGFMVTRPARRRKKKAA